MSWPTILLGELVNVQTGKLDANASSVDGAYPFFTCAREPLRISEWQYDLDAILIAGNGDLNVKHYIGKFDAYQRTYILDVKKTELLDSRFLFHFMDKYVERLREQSIGGIIKYIKLGMLTEAKIPLPPLPEQKRIAAILDQADTLRRLRARALDKLNSLGQAIFHEMFGEGDGIPRMSLCELVQPGDKINYGVVQPGDEVEGGVPLLRAGDILSPELNPATFRTISPAVDQKHRKSRLQGDEILVACVGSIGAITLAHSGLTGVNIARAVARIPVASEIANRTFLAEQLKTKRVQDYFKREIRLVAQPTLNIKQISSTDVFIPPVEDQMRFSSVLTEVVMRKDYLASAISKQGSLFASLQHRAFRGEL